MNSPHTLQQFAWLFIRGDESVYIRVEEQGDVFQVIISGPRWAHVTYDFHDAGAMNTFITEHQQQLIANGYHLQAKAERRAGRRSEDGSPPHEERRRR